MAILSRRGSAEGDLLPREGLKVNNVASSGPLVSSLLGVPTLKARVCSTRRLSLYPRDRGLF